MQRYFASKWASIVLGSGIFFVIIGLFIVTNKTLMLPWLAPKGDYSQVTFSLFFYGGLQMAMGITALLFLHLKKTQAFYILNSLIFVFFYVPIPGAWATYPQPNIVQTVCGGFGCLAVPVVHGSLSYWLTGFGGVFNGFSISFPYVSYWVGFG